ncbi:hypothetical protein P5673_031269 [Acropora cervicornis]|uniref:Uncharacterized protein n=1 Tax=Acropora cervicornis TaxID=6130 RepID=A0AAD9PTA2_ACRCE|nr:hypothetical protein P5673_031269 [Acropora cervicornis]
MEREKVKRLLRNSAKVVTKSVANVVPATNYSNLEAMFLGCHKRLDQIIQLLEKLVDQKEEVAQSSRPMIHDTPPSKPKAFMSQNTRVVSSTAQSSGTHTQDNSMSSEDLTDDPDFIVGECIQVRCGDKVFDRNWSDIRKSMNQKCLDKLKESRNFSPSTD